MSGTLLAATGLLGSALSGAPASARSAPVPGDLPVVVADVPGPLSPTVADPVMPSTHRVLVRWSPGTSSVARARARGLAATRSATDLGDRDFELLDVAPGKSVARTVRTLRADPRVAAAERDRYLATSGAPDDPDLPLQWSVNNSGAALQGFSDALPGGDVDVLPAWDRTVGTPQVAVAVIDSGYDFLNPDLGQVAWTNPGEIAGNGVDDDGNGMIDDTRGWDFVGADVAAPVEDNDPTDDDPYTGGHALHTAGIIGAAGNDGRGITGIAQDVRLMPLRVCAPSAVGANICSLSAIVAAINYAGRMGARVANLSLGGPGFSAVTADAIAANPRTLYVVSAGNYARDNEQDPVYPCNYDPVADSAVPGRVDNLICVAASDQRDRRASFSNWGARSVDLAAPGVRIWSLYRTGPVWRDDFAVDDFATRWTSTDLGFGRAAAGDGKLTSAGITDSPGTAPAAGRHQVTSVPQEIGTNIRSCKVQGERFVRRGPGGTLSYAVVVDGERVVTAEVADTTIGVMQSFASGAFDPVTIAGKSASLEFTYDAPAGLDAEQGVWLDNLRILCARSSDQPALYDYLSGTSMAAPMVSGGAALLFSLKPAAGVLEVRRALLGSVRKRSAWTGITVTGGRLDIAAAMGRLVPPDTRHLTGVAVSGRDITLNVAQNGSLPSVRFQCRLDSRDWVPCNPRGVVHNLRPGRHVLFARAVDLYGNVDPTPAASGFTITGCLVPRLVGGTVARVRDVIPRAGCRIGTVVRPAGVPLRRLKVRATYPRAFTYLPTGAPVKIVFVRR
ncbi:MAG: S8 family serine peptidase [Propionibacteriales bacterium]|nr:S8 family serine peptidase [Propionibacteriales bacterium]